MYWLKELELTNYQKHEHLLVNFTNGVNVIYGPSDCGKSNLRRAISTLFFNDPSSDDVIRHEGSKKTSVRGIIINGDKELEVERIKSATINRYIIRIKGQEEKVWDAIGRDLPEEVKNYLQMNLIEVDKIKINLNIAEQICLPFLSDVPGSTRLKLFNQLTGNELLDLVSQNFNKEIINITRSLKVEKEVVATNEPEVQKIDKELNWKNELGVKLGVIKKNIDENYQKLFKAKDLQEKLAQITKNLRTNHGELATIKILDESLITCLKERNVTFSHLNSLKQSLNDIIHSSQSTMNQIDKIKTPNLDSIRLKLSVDRLSRLKLVEKGLTTVKEGLKAVLGQIERLKEVKFNKSVVQGKIDKLEKLTGIAANLAINNTKIQDTLNDFIKIEGQLPVQEKEYKDILKQSGICPTCKAKITDEHLEHVKL